jgi:hypothetical protein
MRRLAGAMVLGAGGFVALHELGRRWGATPDELRGPMAGDQIVPDPKGQTTPCDHDRSGRRRRVAVARADGLSPGRLVHVSVGRSIPLAHRQSERGADRPGAAGPVGRRHRSGRRTRHRVLPRGGAGRASHARAALHVARTAAIAGTDDRRLDVGVRTPPGGPDDHSAAPSGSGDVRAVVGPPDLRRHDRAKRLRDGESMLRGIARRAEGRLSRADLDGDARRSRPRVGDTAHVMSDPTIASGGN